MYKIAIYEDELIKLKRIEYVVRQVSLMHNLTLEITIFESKEELLKEKYNKFDFIIDGKNKQIETSKIPNIKTYDMSDYYIEGKIVDIEAFSNTIVKMLKEYKKDDRNIECNGSKLQRTKSLINRLKNR